MTETYSIGKLFSRLLLFNLSVFPNTPEREVNWFLQLLRNRDLLLFISHRIPQYQIYLACSGWNEHLMLCSRYLYRKTRIPYYTSRWNFRLSRIPSNLGWNSRNFEIHLSCMTCYDNKCVLEIITNPEGVFVVSLSKFHRGKCSSS